MSNKEMLATLMTINLGLLEILNMENNDLKDLRIANLGLFVNHECKNLTDKIDLEREES